jgi:hypothetical protein
MRVDEAAGDICQTLPPLRTKTRPPPPPESCPPLLPWGQRMRSLQPPARRRQR